MILQPITPFEPILTEDIPKGENWIGQIKWDGVRILTYFDGQEVKLYNRKKNERTLHYPELQDLCAYCRADSVILDGEMIALGNDGKPSFHEIMRRDGLRRLDRLNQVRNNVNVTYMVFDCLFYNNEWKHKWALKDRLELLQHIILPNESVQLVTSVPSQNIHHLYEVIRQENMEGIVIKDLNSTYAIGEKSDRWQKKKNYKDLIAVVGGVTYRGDVVNALLLGLYDKLGQLWYIGHAGTGKLKASDWRLLTEAIKPLITEKRPFINQPERLKTAVWLTPKLTVKIQYIEWTKGHSLRQPVIQAFVNVPPEECVFD
jgi:bifunctional non-homologous end joining protein LigD